MMNPASMMKIMGAMNTFKSNYPQFVNFIQVAFGRGIEEGTIIEISVTKPGEEKITSNIRVLQSDLDLLNSLKDIK